MSTAPLDRARPGTVRERVVEAAAQITTQTGWSSVTMARVAERAGVSRQTVYNELGSKPELGQAVVMRELARFLVVVSDDLDRNADVVRGLADAIEDVLVMAARDPVPRAVLASAHSSQEPGGGSAGASTGLLPFLTTDAAPLITASRVVLTEHVLGRYPELAAQVADLEQALEAVVRLVLSHVMHPSGEPQETAELLARMAARLMDL